MIDYDKTETGWRIRRTRHNLDMKQSVLAGKIGISGGMLSKYENGIARMTFEMAGKIANALGVELDWILYGDKSEDSPDAANVFVSYWRDVSKEKPKNGDEVIAGYWYGDSWLTFLLEYFDGFNCSPNNKDSEITRVTHWMPKPMPPKKEREK